MVKLPENYRKAKGIAIEKILESTQKPWFMLTGTEYNRPSPFTLGEKNKEDDASPQEETKAAPNVSGQQAANERLATERSVSNPTSNPYADHESKFKGTSDEQSK